MVNVDFASPSLVLGAALIGCGVLLLQVRSTVAQISSQHERMELIRCYCGFVGADMGHAYKLENTTVTRVNHAHLQMRNMQTQISRDADIVVAAMVSIVGSTLIFQGWRLDPLLLLCQVGGASDQSNVEGEFQGIIHSNSSWHYSFRL
jgi:hypothetical protein